MGASRTLAFVRSDKPGNDRSGEQAEEIFEIDGGSKRVRLLRAPRASAGSRGE